MTEPQAAEAMIRSAMKRVPLTLLAGLLLAGACTASQTAATPHSPDAPSRFRRSVVGLVIDEDRGRCLPDAQIVVVETGEGALSDSTGAYRLRDLPAGESRVRATVVGYVVESRTLPEPGSFGDHVVTGPDIVVQLTDTLNFYMRELRYHPPVDATVRRKWDRTVPCPGSRSSGGRLP